MSRSGPFTEIGCFWDGRKRAISGDITIFPEHEVIQKCYERAKAAGNNFFGVENAKECFTSKEAGQTYDKYGMTDGCQHGRGGGWRLTVYRVNYNHTGNRWLAMLMLTSDYRDMCTHMRWVWEETNYADFVYK